MKEADAASAAAARKALGRRAIPDNVGFALVQSETEPPLRSEVDEESDSGSGPLRDALTYETVTEQGDIAYVWGEYLAGAFDRINKINSRRIVLYLAKHEPEQRDRDQIRKDLELELTDEALAERLHKLVMADIVAPGSTAFRDRSPRRP